MKSNEFGNIFRQIAIPLIILAAACQPGSKLKKTEGVDPAGDSKQPTAQQPNFNKNAADWVGNWSMELKMLISCGEPVESKIFVEPIQIQQLEDRLGIVGKKITPETAGPTREMVPFMGQDFLDGNVKFFLNTSMANISSTEDTSCKMIKFSGSVFKMEEGDGDFFGKVISGFTSPKNVECKLSEKELKALKCITVFEAKGIPQMQGPAPAPAPATGVSVPPEAKPEADSK